jgi:hypothetical protein|eukprot:COSAG06_NODE_358_length_16848_cov_13.836587_12_plen_149_part_00
MADAAEEEDPPGYVEAEVREFFDKFDSDGSGNVNPDEFRELCEELQPGMEDEAKEEALQELDGTGRAEAHKKSHLCQRHLVLRIPNPHSVAPPLVAQLRDSRGALQHEEVWLAPGWQAKVEHVVRGCASRCKHTCPNCCPVNRALVIL